MTKKEQAEFQAAVNYMNMARAMRWPEYDKPDPLNIATIRSLLPTADEFRTEYGAMRKIVKGWGYNEYSATLFEIGTDGISHCHFHDGKPTGWRQGAGRTFHTKADALRALRYDLTVKYALQLAETDARIKAAS